MEGDALYFPPGTPDLWPSFLEQAAPMTAAEVNAILEELRDLDVEYEIGAYHERALQLFAGVVKSDDRRLLWQVLEQQPFALHVCFDDCREIRAELKLTADEYELWLESIRDYFSGRPLRDVQRVLRPLWGSRDLEMPWKPSWKAGFLNEFFPGVEELNLRPHWPGHNYLLVSRFVRRHPELHDMLRAEGLPPWTVEEWADAKWKLNPEQALVRNWERFCEMCEYNPGLAGFLYEHFDLLSFVRYPLEDLECMQEDYESGTPNGVWVVVGASDHNGAHFLHAGGNSTHYRWGAEGVEARFLEFRRPKSFIQKASALVQRFGPVQQLVVAGHGKVNEIRLAESFPLRRHHLQRPWVRELLRRWMHPEGEVHLMTCWSMMEGGVGEEFARLGWAVSGSGGATVPHLEGVGPEGRLEIVHKWKGQEFTRRLSPAECALPTTRKP